MLRCSEQCEESQEQPMFNVKGVAVNEERDLVEDLRKVGADGFSCAHCGAVAEETEGEVAYDSYDLGVLIDRK